MWPLSSPSSSPYPIIAVLFLLIISINTIEARNLGERINGSVSTLLVFGDSTVDSGNNNYFKTAFKSNFPPYGRDFPNHISTGRFTNGRLTTDFVASYVGVKDYIPPYLDPTLSLDDLKTGVCFASAGSGIDPLTAQLNGVIPLDMQVDLFKEYKTKLESLMGKERTKNLISKAVFLISAGTNDFIVNYYGAPFRRLTYSISSYQKFILHNVQQFIQGVVELGAKNIAVVGLPPIGCVPAVITLNSNDAFTHRGCIESLCSVARDYNGMLQNKLTAMQGHGAKLVYIDIYNPLDDMIKNPRKFGFDKVNIGCCGSGLLEASLFCNTESVVCSDDSKYVFWDAIHPTEAAYYSLFKALRPTIDLIIKNA